MSRYFVNRWAAETNGPVVATVSFLFVASAIFMSACDHAIRPGGISIRVRKVDAAVGRHPGLGDAICIAAAAAPSSCQLAPAATTF
jgi:hypothetical protein